MFFKSRYRSSKFHLNPELYKNSLDSKLSLYANKYQIKIINLIPEDKHHILKAIYGQQWKKIVISNFYKFENCTMSTVYERKAYLSAGSAIPGILSGLADLIPFGHKQLRENDFKEVYKKVTNAAEGNGEINLLCSEFCAHIIIASLVELNKQIAKDGKNSKIVKKLGDEVLKDIVEIPFDKHENLARMHPDRLLQQLQKHNCVEKFSIKALDRVVQSDRGMSI